MEKNLDYFQDYVVSFFLRLSNIILGIFYNNEAYNSVAITQADINEYVSHYAAPGGIIAGFEYCHGISQDAI